MALCVMAWGWNSEKSCLIAACTSKNLGCKGQKYLLKFFVLMSCGSPSYRPCPSYWVVSITNQKQFQAGCIFLEGNSLLVDNSDRLGQQLKALRREGEGGSTETSSHSHSLPLAFQCTQSYSVLSHVHVPNAHHFAAAQELLQTIDEWKVTRSLKLLGPK